MPPVIANTKTHSQSKLILKNSQSELISTKPPVRAHKKGPIRECCNRDVPLSVAGDPVEFLVWLLNTLHSALGGTKRLGSSEVHSIFQGTMRITTRKLPPASEVGGAYYCYHGYSACCTSGHGETDGERGI